jgi:hypothetical protein
LKNIFQRAPSGAKILIAEICLHEPGQDATKDFYGCHFDLRRLQTQRWLIYYVDMMIVANGRERTHKEYQDLLKESGWNIGGVYKESQIGIVEGIKP